MGEIAFVVAQSGPHAARGGISLVFWAVLILVLVFVWDLSRRIRRWFGRSLKARQDLARSVADLVDRMERLEEKLGQDVQPKS